MKLVTVTAVLVCALATAFGAQAARGSTVIRFISVQVSQKQTGESSFVINDNDLINGKKVGHDTLTCKLLSQTKASCSIVIVLPGGKLNAKFVLPFSAMSGKGTVTGGSGKYAGAKGSFAFKNLNAKGTRTSVVVTLA